MDRLQIALTGYRLEQYDQIREWLDAQQKPGGPRLTPQVIIQVAFDELLKQKQAGGTVDIAFRDDRIQHAWRRRQEQLVGMSSHDDERYHAESEQLGTIRPDE